MSDTFDVEPRIDAYRLHEQEWDGYEELRRSFEWDIPDPFNMATYVCDRWAEDDGRVGLYSELPDGTAVEHTFADLREHANRLANALTARGVERGDRVAVNGTQRVENLVAHLAAWKLGAVSVPLSVLLGPEALRYRLDDSDAVAFVVDEESIETLQSVRDELSALETVLTVGDTDTQGPEDEFWNAIDGRSSDFETVATAPEEPGMMVYTSGTTGNPKGVVHPHRSLLGALPGVLMGELNLQVRPEDVNRTVVEWSWIGSLYLSLLSGMYYGIPTVADLGGAFDPEREFQLIEKYGVTATGGPATALRMMIGESDAAADYDLSSVRVVVQGGEALDSDTLAGLSDLFEDAVIHEVYGQTEALQFVSDCEALGAPHEPGKMGKPVPGHEVRVQDPETGASIGAGDPGEIALRYEGNPMCFEEYWNRPEATAEKVQNGWLRSEDIGVHHEDGYLSFRSRTDDVIISSGYKIGPTEIEESLNEHGAVADSGVIGVPHDTRGEIPKAFVVLADGADVTASIEDELKNYVRENLAKYQYPREIEIIDELPKTVTGKVRRRDLREQDGTLD